MSNNVGVDGIDHIRIHSMAETELGRSLSDFAEIPLVSQWGTFKTLMGYAAFLRFGCVDFEKFSQMNGYDVLQAAKYYTPVYNPKYNSLYKGALYRRASTNDRIRELMVASELPFAVYESGNQKLVDHYTKIRLKLKRLDSMRNAEDAEREGSAHLSRSQRL